MMLRLISLGALLSLAACVETATPGAETITAAPEQTAFQGNWKTIQACGDWSQTNILKIRAATPTQILGTTNVGTSSGSIIGGTVVGRDVTFTNTYVATWAEGQTYTEVWIGKLSSDGNSISGTYNSNNPKARTDCTFAGPKV